MFEIIIPETFSLGVIDESDENLSDAIQSTFVNMNDFIIMNWNNISINISCKYDLSFMINDICRTIDFSLTKTDTSLKIAWPSDTFLSIWDLQLNGIFIDINSKWLTVLNKKEGELNKKSKITIEIFTFTSELIKTVLFIIDSLKKLGYSERQLNDYNILSSTLNLFYQKLR